MKLENLINQLPKHSVENDLWSNIDKQLKTDKTLLDRLPVHRANSYLWYNIEDKLPKQKSRLTLFVRNLSVAASIAIIICTGAVLINRYFNPEEVYLTQQVYVREIPTHELNLQNVDIMQNCNDYPAVCSSPDFHRLKSNFEQLKSEELKLRKLKETVNDPKMELYHTRIVKDIQQIEAKMLQMFI